MAMTEPKKIRRLKKLAASEVSLVNRGAIRRPFLVIKNQEGAAMAETSPIVPELTGEHEARFHAIAKRFGAVAKDDAGDGFADDPSDGLDERALAALKAVYRILLPFKGQIPEDALDDVLAELDLDGTDDDNQDADATGDDDDDADEATQEPSTEDDQAMAKFDPEDLKKGADWSPSQADGTSDDDHNKAVMAAKDAYAKAIGKGADDDEDDDKDDDKDVAKSAAVTKASLPIPPEAATLIAKAEGRAAMLEARIAKMEDANAVKGYEDTIRESCTVLGKDAGKEALIVKSAYAANKEAGDAYVALLRDSARMAHQSGVFKSVGTSNNASFGGNAVPNEQGSPKQQLDALINAVVQKGEAADEGAAWNAVMKTKRGQELYNKLHGGR